MLPDEDRAKKVEKWELALRNAIEAGLESAALDILKQTEESISRRPSKEVTSRRSSKRSSHATVGPVPPSSAKWPLALATWHCHVYEVASGQQVT